MNKTTEELKQDYRDADVAAYAAKADAAYAADDAAAAWKLWQAALKKEKNNA